ncbi:MAG: leucine-rich repeat domain-containing protein [Ignavibacteriae bacterium]|nr:leucine-rich repeat domain-containing protein [Ignavibacteriota bacterium]
MKRTTISIFILLLSVCYVSNANELGKRYLKLGNTYREAGNYEKAEEYLKQGKTLVGRDGYWSATANEFLGYLYRDMVASGNYGDNSDYLSALSKESMENALVGFQRMVKQKDGSPIPLAEIMKNINEVKNEMAADNSSPTGRTGNNPTTQNGNAKVVNVDNSKIKEIPTDLPATVENFSAVNNRIKEFPGTLGQFSKLKYLNLKKNKITSIDNGINRLKGLRTLNCSDNKIKSIPQNISDLKQLEILDISNNKLKEIPTSITSLKNLKILDISGNKIQFSNISTLIKNMPNTNIIFDRYELVEEESVEE